MFQAIRSYEVGVSVGVYDKGYMGQFGVSFLWYDVCVN